MHIFKHPSSSHPAHFHALAFGSVFGRRGAAQVRNGPRAGSEHSPRLSAGGRPWQQKHQSESKTCAVGTAECFCGTLETFLTGSLCDEVEQPCSHMRTIHRDFNRARAPARLGNMLTTTAGKNGAENSNQFNYSQLQSLSVLSFFNNISLKSRISACPLVLFSFCHRPLIFLGNEPYPPK